VSTIRGKKFYNRPGPGGSGKKYNTAAGDKTPVFNLIDIPLQF